MMCVKKKDKKNQMKEGGKKKGNVIQSQNTARSVENGRWHIAFLSKWERCRPIEAPGEGRSKLLFPEEKERGLELPVMQIFHRRGASSAFSVQLIYSVHARGELFLADVRFYRTLIEYQTMALSCPPLFRAGPDAVVKESKRSSNNRRAFDRLKMI